MRPFHLLIAALALLAITAVHAQDDPWAEDDWDDGWDDEPSGLVFNGFIEAGLGTRLQSDSLTRNQATLEELRWRIETEWNPGAVVFGMKADINADGIDTGIDAELRDLTAAFTLGDNYDLRVGRQVQTWGTGDLVFLNDLFPKDFVSFFSGRDDEYLKAPGDAVRVTRFSSAVNADFVWTPEFEPDVYLDGTRFSFFSPLAGTAVAPNPPLTARRPSRSFDNGEFALRLFRTVESREYAAYAYHGFFKQPSALTEAFEPTFAPLTALGASLRQPLGPGLMNLETSWYLSSDDRGGTDPLVPNDQLRLLAGYEWEARPRLTVGIQYYIEWTQDHDELIAASLAPTFEPDEFRHVLTNRLTWRSPRDRHTVSLFTFLSPSDRDFYLRPSYSFRHSDQWTFTVGGSLFGGDDAHTFFGQLQDASNAYLRLRYHY